MHTRPMAEHEGTLSKPEEKKYACTKCGKVDATCQEWDSSCGGYTDYKYTCGACGHVRWIDGIDS